MEKHINLRANIALGLIFAFLVNTIGPICPIACSAEGEFRLPAPGQMVALSPAYSPAVLKGIKLDPKNPFRFHFFVDTGDSLPKHNNKDMSFPNVPPGRDPAVTVTSVGNPDTLNRYTKSQHTHPGGAGFF